MPVDKFGRRDTAVQENVISDVLFTHMDHFFLRRSCSNTPSVVSSQMVGL